MIARLDEEMADTSTNIYSAPMRRVIADDAIRGPVALGALERLSDADALRLYLAFLKESMKS